MADKKNKKSTPATTEVDEESPAPESVPAPEPEEINSAEHGYPRARRCPQE